MPCSLASLQALPNSSNSLMTDGSNYSCCWLCPTAPKTCLEADAPLWNGHASPAAAVSHLRRRQLVTAILPMPPGPHPTRPHSFIDAPYKQARTAHTAQPACIMLVGSTPLQRQLQAAGGLQADSLV